MPPTKATMEIIKNSKKFILTNRYPPVSTSSVKGGKPLISNTKKGILSTAISRMNRKKYRVTFAEMCKPSTSADNNAYQITTSEIIAYFQKLTFQHSGSSRLEDNQTEWRNNSNSNEVRELSELTENRASDSHSLDNSTKNYLKILPVTGFCNMPLPQQHEMPSEGIYRIYANTSSKTTFLTQSLRSDARLNDVKDEKNAQKKTGRIFRRSSPFKSNAYRRNRRRIQYQVDSYLPLSDKRRSSTYERDDRSRRRSGRDNRDERASNRRRCTIDERNNPSESERKEARIDENLSDDQKKYQKKACDDREKSRTRSSVQMSAESEIQEITYNVQNDEENKENSEASYAQSLNQYGDQTLNQYGITLLSNHNNTRRSYY
ncbi:hypothetical protein CRE_12431 [Caenorhabditis remanei]|uniref:Uncharacterized protein n=1 Tax=Caenorhabditis remanei TaxID=31234 RepID=E3NRV7_CAERE|nr:hypothetical protein CRE_12431 [Caenorhabditis remanei]